MWLQRGFRNIAVLLIGSNAVPDDHPRYRGQRLLMRPPFHPPGDIVSPRQFPRTVRRQHLLPSCDSEITHASPEDCCSAAA